MPPGGGAVITRQPHSQTVGVGANVLFSVVAVGSSPLSYQWQFNGADLSGAVASSLTLTNAQATNSGTYSVVITNAYGLVTSSNALLAVIVPVCVSAPTNLVSWWRAEGDASDAAGMNSGTLQGGVTFGGGEVGRSFIFDGSSGLVSIPASASLTWGRATASPLSAGSALMTFLGARWSNGTMVQATGLIFGFPWARLLAMAPARSLPTSAILETATLDFVGAGDCQRR